MVVTWKYQRHKHTDTEGKQHKTREYRFHSPLLAKPAPKRSISEAVGVGGGGAGGQEKGEVVFERRPPTVGGKPLSL